MRRLACRHDVGLYIIWPTNCPKEPNTGCLIHGILGRRNAPTPNLSPRMVAGLRGVGQARPGNMGQSGIVGDGLADCTQVGAYEAYSDDFGKESWVELLDTHGLVLASIWTWTGAGSFFTIDCHFDVVILSR